MDKLTRVRNALTAQPVDRTPGSFWFHFPPSQATGKASIQAHLEYYRQSGVDFLKIMNEHPYQVATPIVTPSDWRSLRPAPLSASFYQQQLDEIKQITDALGSECLAITTIFGPYASGNHASDHLVTQHLKIDPQSVSIGLATIAESLAEFALACIQAGAAGIYFSAQGGEKHRFTEEEFSTYIKPHDLMVLNAAMQSGEFNLLHICREDIRMHLFVDYPAHAVNWAVTKHNPSLIEGYTLFNKCVVGGLDDRGVIVNGTPQQIREAVQRVRHSIKANTHFMLGADCTLPTDISIENIRTALLALT